MSKTLYFVLLTVAAVGGAAIDRVVVTMHAETHPCQPQAVGNDDALRRFLAPAPLPTHGGARF